MARKCLLTRQISDGHRKNSLINGHLMSLSSQLHSQRGVKATGQSLQCSARYQTMSLRHCLIQLEKVSSIKRLSYSMPTDQSRVCRLAVMAIAHSESLSSTKTATKLIVSTHKTMQEKVKSKQSATKKNSSGCTESETKILIGLPVLAS